MYRHRGKPRMQTLGHYPQMSVEDANRAHREAMRLLGVDELSRRPMGKLSGGQQQKVMIARALAKKPRILLMDEPFSNLDPESKRRIPELIGGLHERDGLTTVVVTHETGSLMEACRRVVVMDNGRITGDEAPEKALRALGGRT